MTFQYALRFESGKRRGEIVSISSVVARGGAFTIGRKPGNSLQVVDASVSGRHAELEISKDGVDLRDLDSTNGTLLGGRKVRIATLEHGDEFTLGAVEFTLLDQSRDEVGDAGSAPLPAPLPGRQKGRDLGEESSGDVTLNLSQTQITPREDSLEITAEDLARSKRSSKLGPILLVGLAAVGGAAWWWLGQRASGADGSGGRARAAAAAVEAPPGNRLSTGYSFERSEGWANGGSDTDAEFETAAGAARSGRRGMRAELGAGDVAHLESDPVRLSGADRTVRALGFVSGERDVEVRLGLRFSSPDGAIKTTVWSTAPTLGGEASGDDFQEIGVVATAPTGMDAVQVVIRAASTIAAPAGESKAPEGVDGAGEAAEPELAFVDVDDVALVPGPSAGPEPMSIDALTVTPMGADAPARATALAVTSLDRILVSSLRVVADSGSLDAAPLSLRQDGGRVEITVGAAGVLSVRAEALLVAGGTATMARSGGYASHGASFERSGATDVLLGAGANLLRLRLPRETDLSARPHGDAVIVRAAVAKGDVVTLQCAFTEERTRAERLARRAEEERKRGDSGASLRTWNELLTEVPFDQRLVDQAARGQSEILAAGRDELKELAAEVERARFFGLADLYREKLARASELAVRYRGSDVEGASVALADAIKIELRALDSRNEQDESRRLEAIRRVLDEEGAAELARKIEAYRTESGAGSGLRSTAGTRTTDENESTEGGGQ